MVNLQKKAQVDQLSQVVESGSFALVKYLGVPHQKLEELRRELKKNKSRFKVVKKSIFEKAVNKLATKNKNLKELQKKVFPLRENTAILTFEDNYMLGLAAFAKFLKGQEGLEFKLGLLDGTLYLSEEMDKLSKLPSKDQLRAQVIANIKAVSQKFVYTLKFNTSKFVHVLVNVKGGETNG